MALDDIASVNITAETRTPTLPGFGTICLMVNRAPASVAPGTFKTYTKAKDMTSDSWSSSFPGLAAAQVAFSQNPAIRRIKVFCRPNPVTQTFTLKILTAVEDRVYSVRVGSTTYAYTALAGDDSSEIATALAALIDAGANWGAAATTNTITVTVSDGDPGLVVDAAVISKTSDIEFKSTTPDTNLSNDLAAALALDPDFYGVALDHYSHATAEALATWVESNEKVSCIDTMDTLCKTNSTTDICSVVKSANLGRTAVYFNGQKLLSNTGIAAMAERFPHPPGASTFAYKTLRGVPTDVLTPSEEGYLLGKNANIYTAVAGLSLTQYGTSASGEFLDITIGRDWLKQQIQRNILVAKVNRPKIPFTDPGIAIIVSAVDSALKAAVKAGVLAADPAPLVTAPKAAEVAPADKIARRLPDVSFTATLSGAVHLTEVSGAISA